MWPASGIVDGWLQLEGFARSSPEFEFASVLRQTGLAQWWRVQRLKRGCRR